MTALIYMLLLVFGVTCLRWAAGNYNLCQCDVRLAVGITLIQVSLI